MTMTRQEIEALVQLLQAAPMHMASMMWVQQVMNREMKLAEQAEKLQQQAAQQRDE